MTQELRIWLKSRMIEVDRRLLELSRRLVKQEPVDNVK
jgi:hypothetical protein